MQISPLDESGNAVDWWFICKVPKLAKSGATASATGYEYVYYDTTVGKVTRSPNLLTDGKGALDLTLDAVFMKPAAAPSPFRTRRCGRRCRKPISFSRRPA